MNIARAFSAYRLLEAELDRERQAHERTRQEAVADRQALVDAFARARGASPVYGPQLPPEDPFIGRPAVGPTAVAAREAAVRARQERLRRQPVQPTEDEIAQAAAAALNQPISYGDNGAAEPPEPIAPDQVI